VLGPAVAVLEDQCPFPAVGVPPPKERAVPVEVNDLIRVACRRGGAQLGAERREGRRAQHHEVNVAADRRQTPEQWTRDHPVPHVAGAARAGDDHEHAQPLGRRRHGLPVVGPARHYPAYPRHLKRERLEPRGVEDQLPGQPEQLGGRGAED
jgi:hypothetical protein